MGADQHLRVRGVAAAVAAFLGLAGIALGTGCSAGGAYGADESASTEEKGAKERPRGESRAQTESAPLGTLHVAQIEPASLRMGSSPTTVMVVGSGFDASSRVVANGAALTTALVSPTQLSAQIPAEYLASAGTMVVSVVGGSARSNDMPLSVVAGAAIASLAPTGATTTTANVALTVNGSGFEPSSVVIFNGTDLSTQALSTTQLKATIPAALLTQAGQYNVAVRSGGGLSSTIAFTVSAAVQQPTVACNGGVTCAELGLFKFQCIDDGFGPEQCEEDGCVYPGCL